MLLEQLSQELLAKIRAMILLANFDQGGPVKPTRVTPLEKKDLRDWGLTSQGHLLSSANPFAVQQLSRGTLPPVSLLSAKVLCFAASFAKSMLLGFQKVVPGPR